MCLQIILTHCSSSPPFPSTYSALYQSIQTLLEKILKCWWQDFLQIYTIYLREALKTAKLSYFLRNFTFPFCKMTISCFSIPLKYPNSLFSLIWCFCCLLSGLWKTLWSYHHQPFSFCTLILHISLPLPSFVGYPLHLLEVTKEHNPSNYPPVSDPPVSSTSPSLPDYAFKLLWLCFQIAHPKNRLNISLQLPLLFLLSLAATAFEDLSILPVTKRWLLFPSFCKDIFTGNRILDLRVFALNTLKLLIHSLPASNVAVKRHPMFMDQKT